MQVTATSYRKDLQSSGKAAQPEIFYTLPISAACSSQTNLLPPASGATSIAHLSMPHEVIPSSQLAQMKAELAALRASSRVATEGTTIQSVPSSSVNLRASQNQLTLTLIVIFRTSLRQSLLILWIILRACRTQISWTTPSRK